MPELATQAELIQSGVVTRHWGGATLVFNYKWCWVDTLEAGLKGGSEAAQLGLCAGTTIVQHSTLISSACVLLGVG